MSTESDDERERVAEELRRVRDAVRERAFMTADAPRVLPPPAQAQAPQAIPREPEPSASTVPAPPDGSAVNALWEARPAREPRGLRGTLTRILRRLLAGQIEAQVAFNSKQVQLDNEIVQYIDRRFAATHEHYDRVLGIHGRHMGEIDERHLILQEELVAHVHDLVRRIDLVLSEAERGRLSLEFALRDLRSRVARLEERLLRG